MTGQVELRWGVPGTDRTRPSEEFGRKAVDLAREHGISTRMLAKAIDKSMASIERLQQGKGSMEVGFLVKRHLVSRRIDISSLPPLDETAGKIGLEDWELEWLRVGRLLRLHSKPGWWDQEYTKLKRLADALELQATELDEASRAT